jgi:transcriptional regulator with XRE-family HTH domain
MYGLTGVHLNELRNRQYRHAYVDEFLHTFVAAQIRALRKSRRLSQKALAELAEMKQSRISVLEDVNYTAWNISTLRELAKAFDVCLVIKFEGFSRRLREISEFTSASLLVPSFEDDQDSFSAAEPIQTTGRGDLILERLSV